MKHISVFVSGPFAAFDPEGVDAAAGSSDSGADGADSGADGADSDGTQYDTDLDDPGMTSHITG